MMYKIPDNKKADLKIPLGPVYKKVDKNVIEGRNIVTVGDFVTEVILNEKIKPALAIIDNKTERKEYKGKTHNAEEVIKIKNPPGTITHDLWNAIATAYTTEKETLIIIDGEEDLAALPAIYLAPKKTTVIYGMPKKGMVIVNVNSEKRKLVEKFLNEIEE